MVYIYYKNIQKFKELIFLKLIKLGFAKFILVYIKNLSK